MNLINTINSRIEWDKPVNQQLERLAEFDNITDEELMHLAQKGHKSRAVGVLLEYLGPERLKPFFRSFLVFLQDLNWGAAGGAANMFVKAGREAIPEIRRVFYEVKNDEIWHYWILVVIVGCFERDLILELKEDLIDLIGRADKEGAAIEALRILKENNIVSEEEVESHFQFLIERYKGDDYWTEELIEEIKPAEK